MKTYLVTGVSRGLGRAVATLLLEQGCAVIGTYNANQSAADELASQYEHLTVLRVNLADTQNINALITSVGDQKLDGIVNSAGVFLEIDFADFDATSFEEVFRINTFAPVYIVEKLQNNLIDGGSVVNVASNDALVGSIVGIAYSASKAALLNITQSMANILAPRKIRVNAVAPGWMGDGMQAPQELLDLAQEYNPLKHIASYEEIAKPILFLLSDEASYINGTAITIDGGDMATSFILQKEAEL